METLPTRSLSFPINGIPKDLPMSPEDGSPSQLLGSGAEMGQKQEMRLLSSGGHSVKLMWFLLARPLNHILLFLVLHTAKSRLGGQV